MFKVMDIAREALGSVAKVAAKVPVIENKYHVKDRLRGPWPKGPFLWLHGEEEALIREGMAFEFGEVPPGGFAQLPASFGDNAKS